MISSGKWLALRGYFEKTYMKIQTYFHEFCLKIAVSHKQSYGAFRLISSIRLSDIVPESLQVCIQWHINCCMSNVICSQYSRKQLNEFSSGQSCHEKAAKHHFKQDILSKQKIVRITFSVDSSDLNLFCNHRKIIIQNGRRQQ